MKTEFQRIYTAVNADELEFRTEIDDQTGERKIVGYASLYNSPSQKFKIYKNGVDEEIIERIAPGAFDGADFNDCVFNVEHENSKVVGRNFKNLKIENNDRGLFFELKTPRDTEATTEQNDLVKNVGQGIIRACSFAATIAENEIVRESGKLVHIIKKFGIVRDLTATVAPAYAETWIAKRDFDNLEIPEDKEVKPVEAEVNEVEKMNTDFEFLQLQ